MGGLVLPLTINVIRGCTHKRIPVPFCRPNIMDQTKATDIFLYQTFKRKCMNVIINSDDQK